MKVLSRKGIYREDFKFVFMNFFRKMLNYKFFASLLVMSLTVFSLNDFKTSTRNLVNSKPEIHQRHLWFVRSNRRCRGSNKKFLVRRTFGVLELVRWRNMNEKTILKIILLPSHTKDHLKAFRNVTAFLLSLMKINLLPEFFLISNVRFSHNHLTNKWVDRIQSLN